jgi:hypothetical protein
MGKRLDGADGALIVVEDRERLQVTPAGWLIVNASPPVTEIELALGLGVPLAATAKFTVPEPFPLLDWGASVIQLLWAAALQTHPWLVFTWKEPDGTPPGSALREVWLRADATIDSHRSNRIIPGW